MALPASGRGRSNRLSDKERFINAFEAAVRSRHLHMPQLTN
jgi:hypothetical protein